MNIIAENIGKKFIREWIVRRVNLQFQSGESYTLIGPNGSGKSTLMQLLMGNIPLSEGTLTYRNNDQPVDPDKWYRQLVLAAPYLEVIEEFTLRELIDFHRQFKPFKNDLTASDFEEFIQLPHASTKIVRHFSSGMKQRVRLGFAFLSDVPVIYLDEPTSNLDNAGIQWYLQNIEQHTKNQLLIIGSNQPQEYEFCKNIISLTDFK